MSDRESRSQSAPADFGDAIDPFRAADPPVLLFGTFADRFERAWRGDAGCPVCSGGRPVARGRTVRLDRRWLRFSCGHTATVETGKPRGRGPGRERP